SFALPMPKPNTPWPSPTTTSALKLRFLPPLTTFVTRLIDTTVSLMSSCDGSIRSRVRIVSLGPSMLGSYSEFQSCLARSVRHGANAAVIQEAAAIEHDAFDPFFSRPLGDRSPDRPRALPVAAGHVLDDTAR